MTWLDDPSSVEYRAAVEVCLEAELEPSRENLAKVAGLKVTQSRALRVAVNDSIRSER